MALGSGGGELAPIVETVNTGPGGENRQYQHVLAVAASQELRLLRHAALRKRPGYDLSDPWLVPNDVDDDGSAASSRPPGSSAAQATFGRLALGMPCRIVGSGEVVAFLGLDDSGAGAGHTMCRVRFPDGRVATHAARFLLPMPTRPARQGDWVLAVDLKGVQSHLNGRRGMCGLCGVLHGLEGGDRQGLWVMFEPSDSAAAPEVVLLADRNLVALPTPPPGAARTPWEARHLPPPAPALRGLGDEQRQLAIVDLVDEARAEERLALAVAADGAAQDEESASDAGSVELDGSSSGVEEAEEADQVGAGPPPMFAPSVGDLVSVTEGSASASSAGATPGSRRCGRVEGLSGVASDGSGSANVRLLDQGATPSAVVVLPLAALAPLEERELVLAAVCRVCSKAEPEAELLMCERFSEECLACAHLRCLSPPLKAVPKGAWFCAGCSGSAGSTDGPPPKRSKGAAAEEAKAQPKAKAAGKAAAAATASREKQTPKRKSK